MQLGENVIFLINIYWPGKKINLCCKEFKNAHKKEGQHNLKIGDRNKKEFNVKCINVEPLLAFNLSSFHQNFLQLCSYFASCQMVWPQHVKTVNELVLTKYLFWNFSNSLAKFYLFKIPKVFKIFRPIFTRKNHNKNIC